MQDVAKNTGFDNAAGEFHKDSASKAKNNLHLYEKNFGGDK
jgi:hypothetical protein